MQCTTAEAGRRPDRIYGIHSLADTFGVGVYAAGEWQRTWLARAVIGRDGRTKIYDRETAMRLVTQRRKRSGKSGSDPVPPLDGLLFGPKEVASFLGIAESTARQYRKEFSAALKVKSRRIEDCVWSRKGVWETWRAHLGEIARLHGRNVTKHRWDRVCPPIEGTVRGTRAAAALLNADRRTIMRRQEIFAPAVVAVRDGVRLYDAARLKEIWTAHMEAHHRRLSEAARRTNARIRSGAVLPEGTVLGNAALAGALGIHLNTVCRHLSEFAGARVGRHGRQWIWDVERARGIWEEIRRRNEEARAAGRAEYMERMRLGLEPLRRKSRKWTKRHITEGLWKQL